MTLSYCTLERAHRSGRWTLPQPYTYDWFCAVQRRAEERTTNRGTLTNLLAMLTWVVQRLPHHGSTPADDLPHAIRDVLAASPGSPSLASKHRRLHRAVNFAWFEVHGMLPAPLPVPPPPKHVVTVPPPAHPTTLTEGQVRDMCRVADAHSVRYACFFRLLFATGVRIGAICRMQWKQFLRPAPGEGIQPVVNVLEKGGRVRSLFIPDALQALLLQLHRTNGSSAHGPVFAHNGRPHLAISTRQLRNWWYEVSGVVGVEGHPHLARHYVAHRPGDAPLPGARPRPAL